LAHVETDKRGRFVVKLIPSGVPLQVAFAPPHDAELHWHPEEGLSRTLPPLKPGATTELPAYHFRSANSSLTGVAVDDQGRPLSRVYIDVQRPDGSPCPSDGQLHLTNANGRFHIDGLLADSLRLAAWQFPEPGAAEGLPIARANLDAKAPASDIRLVLKPSPAALTP
jgi:hypothetical protein